MRLPLFALSRLSVAVVGFTLAAGGCSSSPVASSDETPVSGSTAALGADVVDSFSGSFRSETSVSNELKCVQILGSQANGMESRLVFNLDDTLGPSFVFSHGGVAIKSTTVAGKYILELGGQVYSAELPSGPKRYLAHRDGDALVVRPIKSTSSTGTLVLGAEQRLSGRCQESTYVRPLAAEAVHTYTAVASNLQVAKLTPDGDTWDSTLLPGNDFMPDPIVRLQINAENAAILTTTQCADSYACPAAEAMTDVATGGEGHLVLHPEDFQELNLGVSEVDFLDWRGVIVGPDMGGAIIPFVPRGRPLGIEIRNLGSIVHLSLELTPID